MKNAIAAVVTGVLTIPVVAANVIVDALLLSTLWGWFIAPVFHLPMLSAVQAAGISLVITLVTYQYNPTPPGKTLIDRMVANYVTMALILAIGWIIKTYFM